MVKCQVCGEEIGNAIFCENCGSKIPSQKKNKKEKVINNNNEKIFLWYESKWNSAWS